MIKNKILRYVVLTLAFVMLLSFTAFAEETTGDTKVTIGIFSDTHNVADGIAKVMNNFETLAGGNENIDGVALVGDIVYLTRNSTPSLNHYSTLKANTDFAHFLEENKVSFAMGNHEFPEGSGAEAAESSISVFTEAMGFAPETHKVYGGYHFITAGPEDYNGKLTAEQEQYVIDEVTEALKDGEDKPVFVFIHHPIDTTLYGSSTTRHSEEFVAFLKSQPRVIAFSGHNHYPLSDPRSIWQVEGGATFVYTSRVSGGNNLSHPYAGGSSNRHDTGAPAQAYLMEIDTETNVVTLKRFYVGSTPTGLEGGDWVLDIPAMVAESKKDTVDLGVYKYTYDEREKNSTAPVFGEDA
ncbi:MAG: metallophosphoesterase family protein, partial [Clostridia bacterium]|nr:metallophosphoesterase family protein [Clostridia bacterium]